MRINGWCLLTVFIVYIIFLSHFDWFPGSQNGMYIAVRQFRSGHQVQFNDPVSGVLQVIKAAFTAKKIIGFINIYFVKIVKIRFKWFTHSHGLLPPTDSSMITRHIVTTKPT